MADFSRITVFASSSAGNKPEYTAAARDLGLALASHGITLVYGANKEGLAGTLVRAVKEGGGRAVGVMPQFLVDQEKAYYGLDEFYPAEDLHIHKSLMAGMGDAFIGLPGGLGTLEEFFEALTWAQLGIHQKPCGLLNISGFYDRLLSFMDLVCDSGFIDESTRDLILVSDDPDDLLEQLIKFKG